MNFRIKLVFNKHCTMLLSYFTFFVTQFRNPLGKIDMLCVTERNKKMWKYIPQIFMSKLHGSMSFSTTIQVRYILTRKVKGKGLRCKASRESCSIASFFLSAFLPVLLLSSFLLTTTLYRTNGCGIKDIC